MTKRKISVIVGWVLMVYATSFVTFHYIPREPFTVWWDVPTVFMMLAANCYYIFEIALEEF